VRRPQRADSYLPFEMHEGLREPGRAGTRFLLLVGRLSYLCHVRTISLTTRDLYSLHQLGPRSALHHPSASEAGENNHEIVLETIAS
jgi:hypothetical protein